MDVDVMKYMCDIWDQMCFETVYEVVYRSDQKDLLPTTEDGVPIRKIFVGNISQRTTHKDLERYFSKYGKVDSCYLKITTNEKKNRYAFITYTTVEDAMKARQDGIKRQIHLHNRVLRVSPADSWHQPDSVENQRRLAAINKKDEGSNSEEQPVEDATSYENTPIHRLNDDCLTHIFLFLPIVDRVKIERVCVRWRAVSHESWRAVKKLEISQSAWGISPEASKINIETRHINTATLRKVLLRCGRFLHHIDCSQPSHGLQPSTLTVIGKLCPNLQTVNITGLNVSSSGIHSLTDNCRNITKLSLGSCNGQCDSDLIHLFMTNNKLKCFQVVKNGIVGKCLEYLPQDTIEEISLESCNAISPCYFYNAIMKFDNLKALTINTCVSTSDRVIQAIGTRESLQKLTMEGYFPLITSTALYSIAALINLEVLNVSHNPTVNNDFLLALTSKCKELKYIDISCCTGVSDVGVVGIASLPKLEHFLMSYLGDVTDEPLAEMSNLKVLVCRGCPVVYSSGIMTLLEISPQLEEIDLSGCDQIGNEVVEFAIRTTRNRTNNIVLKMTVGGTAVDMKDIFEVSPFLQIVNVNLSLPHLRPDFDHDVFFPSADEDSEEDMFLQREFSPEFLEREFSECCQLRDSDVSD